ncbi:hypothetical protein M0R45_018753 [Rubus argutus]|uniref:Oligosaccharyltransferase complex subunit n=1 Tax=Rubus argutus TaxID=59490 RepID=A0AAW1X5D2_RUBAR
MPPKSETLPPPTATAATLSDPSSGSIDPIVHVIQILPYSFLRPPRLRLKLPTLTLPSPMTVYALVLLTYFMVVSGIVYDVIVEPPGIGSTQDRLTGSVRPCVKVSYATAGISSIVLAYVMSMLFIRIKIPGYLH